MKLTFFYFHFVLLAEVCDNMLSFLQSRAVAALPASIVLGNNACDLDSVVSSIMYAYFLDATGMNS